MSDSNTHKQLDEVQDLAQSIPSSTIRRRTIVPQYTSEAIRKVYYTLKQKQREIFDFVRESESQSESESDSSGRKSTNKYIAPVTEPKPTQRNVLVSQNRPSLLSSDSRTGVSMRGFLNLAITILVVSHFRLMLENIRKYGFLLGFSAESVTDFLGSPYSWPSVSLVLSYNLWIISAYLIEKGTALYIDKKLTSILEHPSKKKKKKPHIDQSTSSDGETKVETVEKKKRSIKEKRAKILLGRVQAFVRILYVVHILSLLLIPITLIYTLTPHPLASMIATIILVILFMKLVSYSIVNHSLRATKFVERFKAYESGEKLNSTLLYPHNITLADIYYFLLAPTLVYEESYPRTDHIRWGWLSRRIFELIFFLFLQLFIIQQYIVPLVQNAMIPLSRNDIIGITERLMKLTVPNIICWIMMFYTLFHLFLNISGEILRFGDRLFYLDWWNSTDMAYFWRCWNIPVHKWLVLHVYLPLVKRGYSQSIASFWVFFISAVFHEVVVSIPFNTLKLWAFTAMMAQMPICLLTKKYTKGKQVGNVLFWGSFMFGQANCIMMYYYDFYHAKVTVS
jgi:diacylglycerol O-acyltransferase-1